ncbi:MAG TPA: MFS transporter [Verrucomicrobiae bacterium]|jgi:MFS family permease|nr:MFS transporter [Verrucomicrobiae bacterium]
MTHQRWLRIIPVALVAYTISYVDRTNVSLALDPKISTMLRDLAMDDRMKGQAAGIFFLGYVLLQALGGHLATRWSAKKLVSLCLIFWGACAIGCGLAKTFTQFEATRFLLGVAESSVYPAIVVLLAHWFPRAERARANAAWNLCQPLAVAASAPVTGWLLGVFGWQTMLVLEGILPFVWLPLWWFFICDHPRDAKWISAAEREFLETTLEREQAELESPGKISVWSWFLRPEIAVMIVINFLHNSQAYGCMTFFTDGLKTKNFSAVQYGLLFAIPYAVTAVIMILNSWHSDKTHERRGHVAFVYTLSGASLIASVLTRDHFWLSYAFMCLAIPGPFAALAPFWAIPTETMPRNVFGPVIGLVNAIGNIGGFAGPYIVGWLAERYQSTAIPFNVLGVGMLLAAALAFLLPGTIKPRPEFESTPSRVPPASSRS